MSVMLILAAVAATAPVRDPFWPVGYEGERRVISPELRFEAQTPPEPVNENRNGSEKAEVVRSDSLDPVSVAEAERFTQEMSVRWAAAAKTLRFGGTVRMKTSDDSSGMMTMLVNGKARSAGDLVRTDHDGFRFVWRVEKSDAERELRLTRVKVVRLDAIKEKRKE